MRPRSTTLEQTVAHFRGDPCREMSPDDFVEKLAELLGLRPVVADLGPSQHSSSNPLQFESNADLWNALNTGRAREGQRVYLHNFAVLEWIPLAPGRYFTNDAEEARTRAKEYFSWTSGEYLPLGKADMILGGVGSVRLSSVQVNGKDHFLLGASSTGVSHQGIIVAIPSELFDSAAELIVKKGGFCASIGGRLRVVPRDISLIVTDKNIPRYYVIVDELRDTRPPDRDLLITVSVMFSGTYYDSRLTDSDHVDVGGIKSCMKKQWSFCSFRPEHGLGALQDAAGWLFDYCGRWSGSKTPLLSDFDEHMKHFDQPIEFPLSNIVRGGISTERLVVYGDYYGFGVNVQEEQVHGDKYTAEQVGSMGRNASAHDQTFVQRRE